MERTHVPKRISLGRTGLVLSAAALAAPQAAAQIVGGRGNPMGVWLERVHAPALRARGALPDRRHHQRGGRGRHQRHGPARNRPPRLDPGGGGGGHRRPAGHLLARRGRPAPSMFAWITPPALPHTFAYTLAVPEGESGPKRIHGALEIPHHRRRPPSRPPSSPRPRAPSALAPVITLRGDNPATLPVGGVWEDPGYMAVDAGNQDITAKVVVSGAVDTATPGPMSGVRGARRGRDPGGPQGAHRECPRRGRPGDTAAPAAPGRSLRRPGDPRETSNAIAATTAANPLNAARSPLPPPRPPGGARFQRPELPDVSGLRPDPVPPGGETAAPAATQPAPDAAAQTAAPGAPAASVPAAAATAAETPGGGKPPPRRPPAEPPLEPRRRPPKPP